MNTTPMRMSRREMLKQGTGLLGGLAIALLVKPDTAAASKAAKSDFFYQDHPHVGKDCAECKFFSPSGDASATGTCALVDGEISRNGWCLGYSPK